MGTLAVFLRIFFIIVYVFLGNFTAHRFAARYGDYIEEGARSSEVIELISDQKLPVN